jgi:hypothetical protein
MTQLKFVGRISKMGDNLIIWIPQSFHDKAKQMKEKQIKIIIDDEI